MTAGNRVYRRQKMLSLWGKTVGVAAQDIQDIAVLPCHSWLWWLITRERLLAGTWTQFAQFAQRVQDSNHPDASAR
jgi:hypothetical protein